jgi:hypothetical protein
MVREKCQIPPGVPHDTTVIAKVCRGEIYWQQKSPCGLWDHIPVLTLHFHMAFEDGPSWWVLGNDPNFVETEQEWFDEEDLCDVDV